MSKSKPVNRLSAARFFLFGSRDVWFVVALPVYLQLQLGWSSTAVGTFLAVWIIGYGAVQAAAPSVTGARSERTPDGRSVMYWGMALIGVPLALIGASQTNLDPSVVIVTGLLIFGVIFAMNSAIHSYLIVSYADHDGVTLDVGFYYMSNAAGRLVGTILSGGVFQLWGLEACLAVSAVLVICSTLSAATLPTRSAL